MNGYQPLFSNISTVPKRITTNQRPLTIIEVNKITKELHNKHRVRRLGECDEKNSNIGVHLVNRPQEFNWLEIFATLLQTHSLLVSFAFAIILAAIFPSIGTDDGPIYAQYTISYGATIFIFILLGLSIKISDIITAITDYRLALKLILLQIYSLLVIPTFTWAISLFLRSYTELNDELINGLVILSCLPTTISTCVVLTISAKGHELLAIAMATFGNTVGVVLTPLMILVFLPSEGGASLSTERIYSIYLSLCIKVFIPMIFGIILQSGPISAISIPCKTLVKDYSVELKKALEILLAAIVYRTFCVSFSSKITFSVDAFFAIIALDVFILSAAMVFVWLLVLLPCLQFTDKERVAGLFSATHKTIALGIPMMNEMFAGRTNAALLTIPLLIYHPTQIIIGSLAAPYLKGYIENNEKSAPVLDDAENRDSLLRTTASVSPLHTSHSFPSPSNNQ